MTVQVMFAWSWCTCIVVHDVTQAGNMLSAAHGQQNFAENLSS